MLSNLKEKFLLFQLSVVLEVFHELDLIAFKIKWPDCRFIHLSYVLFVDKKTPEDEKKNI